MTIHSQAGRPETLLLQQELQMGVWAPQATAAQA